MINSFTQSLRSYYYCKSYIMTTSADGTNVVRRLTTKGYIFQFLRFLLINQKMKFTLFGLNNNLISILSPNQRSQSHRSSIDHHTLLCYRIMKKRKNHWSLPNQVPSLEFQYQMAHPKQNLDGITIICTHLFFYFLFSYVTAFSINVHCKLVKKKWIKS